MVLIIRWLGELLQWLTFIEVLLEHPCLQVSQHTLSALHLEQLQTACLSMAVLFLLPPET